MWCVCLVIICCAEKSVAWATKSRGGASWWEKQGSITGALIDWELCFLIEVGAALGALLISDMAGGHRD